MTGVLVISFATAGEYEDARKLLQDQKWAEAAPLFKTLHDEDPDSVVIAEDYAQALLRLNRREAALELLRSHELNRQADIAAKSFLSKESFRFYQQGIDWLAKRSYPQACERFERALERDQAHSEILFGLAQCEILDGNAELGIKHIEQIERIYAKTADTSLWKARALALRGRFDEAIPLFNASSLSKNSEPNLEWNALWWGEALLASGEKNQAAQVWENDVKKYPNHLETSLALIRMKLTSAESPNQFHALAAELKTWQNRYDVRLKEKPKKTTELRVDFFDAELLQRSALEVKTQILSRLPVVTPTPSTSNK